MTAATIATSQESPALSLRLRRLVVKSGVGLGSLSADDQALALAWVWAGLPADRVMNEGAINAELRARRERWQQNHPGSPA